MIYGALAILLQLLAPSISVDRRPACEPIPGVEAVTSNHALRWLIVGEQHGTVETPAAFADLVCNIAKSRKNIVVGVEYPGEAQPFIDAYMSSDGGQKARAALLAAPVWRSETQDGRWSEAFVVLFERLRALHRRGAIEKVVAIQPPFISPQIEYERAMAQRVAAASPTPKTLAIVLVGNVHAMVRVPRRSTEPFTPMAGFLPRDTTVTLNAVGNGGAQWTCSGSPNREIICAARDYGPGPRKYDRGLVLESGAPVPYSGALYLGRQTTASPPAIGTRVGE
jgi:hypothetical protein